MEVVLTLRNVEVMEFEFVLRLAVSMLRAW